MNLAARSIQAGYLAQPVLFDIDLRLESGEFVGLIGPNGCGKSTLLRIISGVMTPVSGSVLLDDRNLLSFNKIDIALKMGFVPQSETAVFDFTVRDIVLMGRHPHHRHGSSNAADDYAAVNRALAETDAIHLADRPITQLSGGEHRRVLLARALAQQTPLLLLDEPTAHLDVTHQVELMLLLLKLSRSDQRVGVIAALHDLNQAAEFCDRLILMRAGKVIAEGTPFEIMNSGNLRRAYEADMRVGTNTATGRPMILGIEPVRKTSAPSESHHVHLICGGGSGGLIMGPLIRQGMQVTAGVLNRLDTDGDIAKALDIEVAFEEPFSTIGAASLEEGRRMARNAQTIVISEVPFGFGNLPNLELALEAQEDGKNVILLGRTKIAGRDFTNSLASEYETRLIHGGAERYDRIEDWLDSYLNRLCPHESN